MRLSGLASGMDTESMIKQLMAAERVKVDKVGQQKQIEEWRQNAYNNLNKDLANFILKSKDDLGLSSTDSLGVIHNSSYKNATWVKEVASSDATKLTATAAVDAVNGVHTIEMENLAKGVSGVSKNAVTVTGGTKDSIASQMGFGADEIVEFSVGGEKGSVKFIIGDSITYEVGLTDEQLAKKVADQLKEDTLNNIVRIDKSLSEVSLSEIVSKINNASVYETKIGEDGKKEVVSSASLGIQAGYDSGLDKFFIKTRGEGEKAVLSIKAEGTGKGSDFITKLDIGIGDPSVALVDGQSYKGIDAQLKSYKVDGVEFISNGETIKYPSNNFTINGVNFSPKAEGVSSVTVSSNTDEIFNKVKEFVEGYNKIVDTMNGLVGEKRYSNFKPLTNDERESMSDKEVELWESKAKSGMLKGDEIVSRNIQRVRSDLYENVQGVGGTYNHITDIGITTEKYVSGSMGGKLTIDERKLREMIEKDASGVMDLMFKQPTGELADDDDNLSPSKLKEKRQQSGIITRIYDNLASGMKDIVDKSGLGSEASIIRKVRGKITSDFAIGGSKSRMDKQISEFNKRMDSLNKYLTNKESSYYRQFSAMEQAMQKANSQMGWLQQQFGGGM